jgi:hypothetical protein
VRAESEDRAREVVASSALGSPSADEIRLANQGQFLLGKEATTIAVEFSGPDEHSIRIISANREH